MSKNYTRTKYLGKVSELSEFLRDIHPDDVIAVTQNVGYTVVYKSSNPLYWKHEKEK